LVASTAREFFVQHIEQTNVGDSDNVQVTSSNDNDKTTNSSNKRLLTIHKAKK
jgi:hypothetical protein